MAATAYFTNLFFKFLLGKEVHQNTRGYAAKTSGEGDGGSIQMDCGRHRNVLPILPQRIHFCTAARKKRIADSPYSLASSEFASNAGSQGLTFWVVGMQWLSNVKAQGPVHSSPLQVALIVNICSGAPIRCAEALPDVHHDLKPPLPSTQSCFLPLPFSLEDILLV